MIRACHVVLSVIFVGGCGPAVPSDGSVIGGVMVRAVLPEAMHFVDSRAYGPGVEACVGRQVSCCGEEESLFELVNYGDKPVKWVAWSHKVDSIEVGRLPCDGQFRMRQRGRYSRYVYLGDIQAQESVMCSVKNSIHGCGTCIMSSGVVLGSRAGSDARHPRADLVGKRYRGPEWLAPDDSFVNSHLEEALKCLHITEPKDAQEGMKALIYASRRVHGGVPVVTRPEIVKEFVELVLRAQVQTAHEVAPGAEPERKIVRRAETFDPFDYSLLVLLELVPAEQLMACSEQLGALIGHSHDPRIVELLIKSGAVKEFASNRTRLPNTEHSDLLTAVSARAGDEKAYSSLLKEFAMTREPVHKVRLARLLALLGNEDGLKAVAGQLRDVRWYAEKGGVNRCVRLELVECLRLAFPTERALYVSIRATKDEMVDVEEFCAKRFGVRFDAAIPEEEGAHKSQEDADVVR